MEKCVEIAALITGVIYVILEIRQKNFMWVLGILTSLASMCMFYDKGAYASFVLNVYYFITAFIGLWQWRRDRKILENIQEDKTGEQIHIRRISLRAAFTGVFIMIAGAIALSWGMDRMCDLGLLRENPMSWLDAAIASISAVATWWLVRSYLEQWWLWILANTMSVVLCALFGMWWMALLYVAYVVAAAVGLLHWKKHGVVISE